MSILALLGGAILMVTWNLVYAIMVPEFRKINNTKIHYVFGAVFVILIIGYGLYQILQPGVDLELAGVSIVLLGPSSGDISIADSKKDIALSHSCPLYA